MRDVWTALEPRGGVPLPVRENTTPFLLAFVNARNVSHIVVDGRGARGGRRVFVMAV